MFEKINYVSLVILTGILAFFLYSGGNANWKEAPGRDFYAMAAQSNISAKEKEAKIKKRYGGIEEMIGAGQLEKALLTLKQMETGYKKDAHLYFLQGQIYAKMKLYKESITNFFKAVKLDPDYVDEGCSLYKGTLIKEVTLDAMDYYKGKSDAGSKSAKKLVFAMQRRLAGSCE